MMSLRKKLGGGYLGFFLALVIFAYVYSFFDYYVATRFSESLIELGMPVDIAYINGEAIGTIFVFLLVFVPVIGLVFQRPDEPTRFTRIIIIGITFVIFFVFMFLYVVSYIFLVLAFVTIIITALIQRSQNHRKNSVHRR